MTKLEEIKQKEEIMMAAVAMQPDREDWLQMLANIRAAKAAACNDLVQEAGGGRPFDEIKEVGGVMTSDTSYAVQTYRWMLEQQAGREIASYYMTGRMHV